MIYAWFHRRLLITVSSVAFAAVISPALAAGQMPAPPAPARAMPDASMMSGIPMPAADLPAGTVSVRLVRGELTNVIADHPVELAAGGKTETAKTDTTGHAVFTGVKGGTQVTVAATVDGQRVESQTFMAPEQGGMKLMLVASRPGTDASAPPVAGDVTFAADSRIAVEFDDDTLSVFYLLEIANPGTRPVNPLKAVAFELPADAVGASVLEGSSPQAQVKGRQVVVNGPFKPGRTSVQVAYQLAATGGSRTISQVFPAAFEGVSIAVQKPAGLQVRSPQIAEQHEMQGDGRTYIVGMGPALQAGRSVTIELTGLPHHATWPRNLALLFAMTVLAVGAWVALAPRDTPAQARRRELERQREALFANLLRVEEARRAGASDPATAADERNELMKQLERVYGELDQAPREP